MYTVSIENISRKYGVFNHTSKVVCVIDDITTTSLLYLQTALMDVHGVNIDLKLKSIGDRKYEIRTDAISADSTTYVTLEYVPSIAEMFKDYEYSCAFGE